MIAFGRDYALAYDYLYQDKDYAKECDFIECVFREFSDRVVKTILDMGCGTGGHALILAQRGYEVVGVDSSKDMLDIARRKVNKAQLPIELVEGNITSFNLQKKFDAVIAMFAVMSYQTTNSDISKACEVAKNHLNPGGVFLFDCWNGLAVLTEKPTMRIKEVKLNDRERIIRFTEPILNTVSHTVEVRFKLFRIQDGYLISQTDESHLMRFLFPQEIKYFLEVAGFEKIKFCPFLKLEKTLTERDWNMAVIACAK
jgi:SAM-dependent methyltransferase